MLKQRILSDKSSESFQFPRLKHSDGLYTRLVSLKRFNTFDTCNWVFDKLFESFNLRVTLQFRFTNLKRSTYF